MHTCILLYILISHGDLFKSNLSRYGIFLVHSEDNMGFVQDRCNLPVTGTNDCISKGLQQSIKPLSVVATMQYQLNLSV